ncbi:MFS transporter [Streptomyces capoamus]|uniref:MFS transporter n=1 Tax=Streptomyces capoamus TaxID=68183 RepID=UPI003397335B
MRTSPTGALRRAHIGAVLTFALVGMVNGVLAARIPGLAAKLGLSTGDFGLVVLCWGLAALATSQSMRWLVTALGNRLLLRIGTPLVALAVGLIALSPSYPLLLTAATGFGAASGIAEAMMNAQGSLVERLAGRPLMNGMHAGWSAGAVSGGLLAAGLAAAGVSYTVTVLAVAASALPIACALGWTYLDAPAEEEHSSGRQGLPRIVYAIGALAFCALLIEGLAADWSGLLLTRCLQASPALAAVAYPVFEIATFSGRLCADRMQTRYGARSLLTGAGLATALGVLLVVVAPAAPVAIAGFGLTGLTVCVVVPLTMSVAGAVAPGQSDAAIAQVSAMGYTGLLAGPVVIGFVAEAGTLRSGIAVGIAVALVIAIGSRRLPEHPQPAAAQNSGGAEANEPARSSAADSYRG